MATENKSNKKRKQRYLPHNKPVKKEAHPLHPGIQGFCVTCDGGREHQASHEAINVIDYMENSTENSGTNFASSSDHESPVRQNVEPSQSNPSIPPSSENSKKRKERKTWSNVWNHFEKFFDKDGKTRARCMYCHKDYAADTSSCGTSTISAHLKRCLKNPHLCESNQTKLAYQQSIVASIEGGGLGALKNWVFDQEKARMALSHMIIVDELPFSVVEREGFKYFLAIACPNFKIPSRSTITRDCFKLYIDERSKLKNFLKTSCDRISLTTDTWTSEQRINCMCLTGHFIDKDWNLHKKVLNFCPITSHRGEAIGKAIELCLLDWGIEKVFCLTVDNASSNEGVVGYLKRILTNWGTNILGGKFLHVRCVAHIINLVVSDGLKEMGVSVSRVRAVVKYVRQSPARLKKFKECVEMEKCSSKRLLCVDVPTRWNSTYLMLDTAEKFEAAFVRFEEQDPHFKSDLEIFENGVPTEEDWMVVRRFVMFLQRFYHLTLRLSGSLYVTSNLVFKEISNVYGLLKKWEQSGDPELRSMARRMLEKYNKYWGTSEKTNLLIYIASILDPRRKFEYVNFVLNDMYGSEVGMGNIVKDSMYELFAEYKKIHECVSSNSNLDMDESGDDDIYWSVYREKMCGSESGNVYSELDKYLCEVQEDPKPDFNILNWWRDNGFRFPIVAMMARDILAVPVSTVASECTFSMGGRVLDSFRSSLTPKIAQAIICGKDWLRTSGTPISVEEDLDNLESLEKDFSDATTESAMLDLLF